MMNTRNIFKTAAKNIRALSTDDALAVVANKTPGIGSTAIRDLTGGFSSQAIDAQVLRALGIRIRGGSPTLRDFIV